MRRACRMRSSEDGKLWNAAHIVWMGVEPHRVGEFPGCLHEELLPAWGWAAWLRPGECRRVGHAGPSSNSEWTVTPARGAPAGSTGVIVELVADDYIVQLIEADGGGNLVGPIAQQSLTLLATRGE